MTGALLLAIGAVVLGWAAMADLVPARRSAAAPPESGRPPRSPSPWSPVSTVDGRLRLSARLARAGLAERVSVQALLAVGTAAGRSPLAGLGELGAGEGPLARELAMLSAESSCGLPQSEALASLRRRAPVREVAAMCGVIERSRRYGSPLADQLREQATALRGVQRRRIEEHAARAAPKIQLAVALLLVPSVLLMIAAGLLANVDRFMAGF